MKGRKLRVACSGKNKVVFIKEMFILYYYQNPEHLSARIPHDSFSVINNFHIIVILQTAHGCVTWPVELHAVSHPLCSPVWFLRLRFPPGIRPLSGHDLQRAEAMTILLFTVFLASLVSMAIAEELSQLHYEFGSHQYLALRVCMWEVSQTLSIAPVLHKEVSCEAAPLLKPRTKIRSHPVYKRHGCRDLQGIYKWLVQHSLKFRSPVCI